MPGPLYQADVPSEEHTLNERSLCDLNTRRLGRVKIRHALSGNTVCLPGPATRANGWSLPSSTFYVNDVVGKNVLMVDNSTDMLTKECKMVSAVVTSEGFIAHAAWRLCDVSDDGWISVLTGNEVLPFQGHKWQDKPCANVDGIQTPPTPGSSVG